MFNKRWFLVAIITSFIFFNSLTPGSESGALSGSITAMLYPYIKIIFSSLDFNTFHYIIRKTAHFSEYFVLGLSIYYAHHHQKSKNNYYLLFFFFIPICDEIIQYFTPNRAMMVTDMIIDSCGMLCAMLFLKFCFYILASIRQNKMRSH